MEKLDKKQIIDLLPHREPMLLIDELINIVKLTSATAIVNVEKLKKIHLEENRRIWFCGSYAQYAVPLLESACSSAVSISERFGCKLD